MSLGFHEEWSSANNSFGFKGYVILTLIVLLGLRGYYGNIINVAKSNPILGMVVSMAMAQPCFKPY
jgi:hypothetical protein